MSATDLITKFQTFLSLFEKVKGLRQAFDTESDAGVKEAYEVILKNHLAKLRTAWMDLETAQFDAVKTLETL